MAMVLVSELVLFILGPMARMKMMRVCRGRNSVSMPDWFLKGWWSLWIVMMKRGLALDGLDAELGIGVGCKNEKLYMWILFI